MGGLKHPPVREIVAGRGAVSAPFSKSLDWGYSCANLLLCQSEEATMTEKARCKERLQNSRPAKPDSDIVKGMGR